MRKVATGMGSRPIEGTPTSRETCAHDTWQWRAELITWDHRHVAVCVHCGVVRVGDKLLPHRPRPLRAKAPAMDDFVLRQHDRGWRPCK